MEKLSVRIGKRIRNMREARGWTRDYLSQLTGINAAYLMRIELAQVNTSLDKLEAIALALQVPLASLFYFEYEQDRSSLEVAIKNHMARLSDDTLKSLICLFAELPSENKEMK